jgi:hypothetical protein
LQDYDNIDWLLFLNQCVRKKKAEQEKYKQPIAPKVLSQADEIVNLDNGLQ